VNGLVRLEPDGSARLLPEDPTQPPVYLPPEEAQKLRTGDTATVQLEVGRKGRMRGRVVKQGRSAGGKLVGIVRETSRGDFVIEPQPFGPAVLLEATPPELRAGDAVLVDLRRGGDRHRPSVAALVEILGRAESPAVQVDMLIRQHGLPMEFSAAALAEAESAPPPHPEIALRDAARRDLREVPHVTIDGADARDFDDAVAARAEPEGVRVWVSIADVSHYVTEGSPLDRDARERGTSVYFPNRVIPMLPERLSNDLCSLRPREPRLTLTAEMRIREDGRFEDVRLYPSLIESRGRLTYEQVQAVIAGQASVPDAEAQRDSLELLLRASRALRGQRTRRGGIDLDLPEAQVIVDAEGVARNIRERQRLEAHRLIEDLMIAANEAVAGWLHGRDWPAVYRVHEQPSPERALALATWAQKLGIDVDVEAFDRPRTLAQLADRFRDLPERVVGQTLLLRSLAQARYAEDNLGHFGLASRGYVHFTSPIRRYPDLLVHRALRAAWTGGRRLVGLDELAARASQQERRAMDAERSVVDLMSCHVAEQRLGEELDAAIAGVHLAGAFVRTKDPLLDGLIPMQLLSEHGRDYFDVIEDEHLLLARRSGFRIALGDPVRVRIARVDTRMRRIDFEPVALPGGRSRGRMERPAPREERREPPERRGWRSRDGGKRDGGKRGRGKPGRGRR
jgi:ribonuclease R